MAENFFAKIKFKFIACANSVLIKLTFTHHTVRRRMREREGGRTDIANEGIYCLAVPGRLVKTLPPIAPAKRGKNQATINNKRRKV